MAKQRPSRRSRSSSTKTSHVSKSKKPQSSRKELAAKVKQLKRQLSESSRQLSASTDVLHLISSSGALVQIFDAVLENALKLCEAAFGFLTIYDGKRFDPVAQHGVPDALAAYFAKGM